MTGKHDVKVTKEQFMDPKYMGCGEFNPLDPTEKPAEVNRRVVLLLFDPKRLPPLPCVMGDIAPCKHQFIADQPRYHEDKDKKGKGFQCSYYDSIAKNCPEEGKKTEQVKRKNIIFIGSEMHYDSFWLKMMFIAPGFTTGEGKGPIRPADQTVVAYVDEGYTFLEKLPLDTLRKKYGHTIVKVTSSSDIIKILNDTSEQMKLQHVIFFSHGLPSQITMNYEGKTEITLDKSNLSKIRPDVFVEDGAIWSYACRTGTSSWLESFKNDAEAKPENSLAQKMANHFKIDVHAFLTRSHYRFVLRDPKDSDKISATLKSKREGHETEVIDLSDEHEALPHEGLADYGSAFWGTGPIGEGTNEFALWRKQGARVMPKAHKTPSGLTQKMVVFKPGP